MELGHTDIAEIAEKYGLRLLVCFGSYLTEYYGPESDIDLAYLARLPLKPEEQVSLLKDLIIYYRKSEIDLVDLRTAEPILRYVIARDGRLFFEEEEGLWERYSIYYIKRLWELKPYIQEEMKAISRRIREVIDDGK